MTGIQQIVVDPPERYLGRARIRLASMMEEDRQAGATAAGTLEVAVSVAVKITMER